MAARVALSSVLLLALLPLPAVAQPRADNAPSPAEVQQRRDAGIGFLREAISVSRDLTQPANRIYIEASCVPLLWDVDESLARSLVKSVELRYREINQQTASMSRNQRQWMQQVYSLRGQVVNAVAPHDANLALEFLRDTRPTEGVNPNQEADLELSLASQAAKQNAQLASELVRNASASNSGMVTSALDQLFQADPAAGNRAATDIIRKLVAGNLTDRQTFYTAINLLQMYANRLPSVPVKADPRGASQAPGVTAAMLQPLAIAVLAAAQKPEFPADLLQNLQNIAPVLEKFSPGATSAIRSIARPANSYPSEFWQQFNDIVEHGTLEQGLEFAARAPQEMRWQAYSRLATKLGSEGNLDSAAEVLEHADIAPEQRRQILQDTRRNAAWAAANKGSFAQARAAVAGIEDPIERAQALAQMAREATNRQQPEMAREIFEEARGLVPSPPTDLQEMSVLAQLAEGYANLDSGRAAEILEPLIATMNQKMPALAQVDGFVGWSHSFVGNEMMLQFGSGADMARSVTNALATLAAQQPERAASLASSLQRPELRTIAYMEMARRLLTQNGQLRRMRGGFGVMRGGGFQF